MEELKQTSDFLGDDFGFDEELKKEPEEVKDDILEPVVEETEEPKKEALEKSADPVKVEEGMYIEGYAEIKARVEKMEIERELNPSVVHDEDAGEVFLNGEPHMIIDDKYVPIEEAKIIIQKRKVVREYLKLQKLINK